MGKNQKRGYITLAILFVVLSVIAFAVPFTKTTAFWLAYIFGVIAIAYQIYIFRLSFAGEGDVKSKFYGFPIAKIGVVYLVAQLIVSIIEMVAAALIPTWVALVVNIIVLAMAAIGSIAADTMRDEIVRQDVQIRKEVGNMRALQSLSSAIVGQCIDVYIKATAQSIADEFKYSDPVSSEHTKELEMELKNQLNELQNAVMEGDNHAAETLANSIIVNLRERNRICALNK